MCSNAVLWDDALGSSAFYGCPYSEFLIACHSNVDEYSPGETDGLAAAYSGVAVATCYTCALICETDSSISFTLGKNSTTGMGHA